MIKILQMFICEYSLDSEVLNSQCNHLEMETDPGQDMDADRNLYDRKLNDQERYH